MRENNRTIPVQGGLPFDPSTELTTLPNPIPGVTGTLETHLCPRQETLEGGFRFTDDENTTGESMMGNPGNRSHTPTTTSGTGLI